MQPVRPLTLPFENVGIDLLDLLPKMLAGYCWIIVCVDYLTRYTETAALQQMALPF